MLLPEWPVLGLILYRFSLLRDRSREMTIILGVACDKRDLRKSIWFLWFVPLQSSVKHVWIRERYLRTFMKRYAWPSLAGQALSSWKYPLMFNLSRLIQGPQYLNLNFQKLYQTYPLLKNGHVTSQISYYHHKSRYSCWAMV